MNNLKFKALYFFIYAPLGVLAPLIGQYLSSIGFSGTEIGTVTAVSTAVSIIASIFWGSRYSNSKDGRMVIFFLCIASAITAIMNSLIMSFVLFTIIYGILYFFQSPVIGLSDAMVLNSGDEFASIRLCGALGYAVAVFAGGKIGEYLGLDKIFYIFAIAFVIAAIVVLTINKEERTTTEKISQTEEKVRYKDLLQDKKMVELTICGIFIFGTNLANNTYFSFLFRDGGGSVAGVGIIFLLMVGSEVPFMAIAPKISAKIGREKAIALAMILSMLRFGWYGTGPDSVQLMATFFVQGMVNGILLVEYIKYISKDIPAKRMGTAVSAFYAISSNGGGILCNFFGGVVMDYLGSSGLYAFFTLLNVIGVGLYFIFGLHKDTKNKREKSN